MAKKSVLPVTPKRPGVAYKPTEKDRLTVEAMAAGNLSQNEICRVIGCTEKTLRKHFAKELDTAFLRAKDTMWRSLFNQGIGSPALPGDPARGIPPTPAIPPNPKATIAWLQFQAGASERVTVVDGGFEGDPAMLSDKDLLERIARLQRSPAILRLASSEGRTLPNAREDRSDRRVRTKAGTGR